MNAWRLLKLETHNAFMNMAIDEAILNARICNLVPNTLRLYRWQPSAVSIGKFQKIENEVQLENCRRLGVDVVRRITGGGTVYHDAEGEITYSAVAGKDDLKAKDITTVYAIIYAGLAEAIKILGGAADFNEGNTKTCPNLTIEGKKVSGSAQSHKNGVVLQHGTLLLDANLEKMFTVLHVPWATSLNEVVNVAKNKITSLDKELGKQVSIEDVSQALIKGFERVLNVKLADGELTLFEREQAQRLCREKYAGEEWTLGH